MKTKFNVTGMTCAACSSHVEKAVSKLDGVSNVTVSLLTNSMTVEYDENAVTSAGIISAVEKSGYGASEYAQSVSPKNADNLKTAKQNDGGVTFARLISSLALCLVLMYVSMGHMIGLPLPSFISGTQNAVSFAFVQFLICLPVWYINRSYYISGFKRLFSRSPNMDTLIAVGSSAGAAYGVVAIFVMAYGIAWGDNALVERFYHQLYFESSAMILALVDLGKYFEGRSKRKTGDALAKLRKLAPDTAILVMPDGSEREAEVKTLKVGDVVAVKNGMAFPADGKVIFGSCYADESAVSGESLPVEKEVNSAVVGGTVSVGGYVKVEVTSVGEDSFLSKIISLVEEAGSSKAPLQRLADKISGVFVPVVMSIALVAFTVWMIITRDVSAALEFGISVLVISCPCALGLATPVAIMVATGKGAENGILIKNGEILERLGKVNCVVLDKTGTVTKGKPAVREYVSKIDETQFFSVVCAMEKQSEHPLGKAVINYAENFAREIEVTEFQAVAGQGIVAKIDGDSYAVGNKRLMENLQVEQSYQNDLDRLSDKALTCLIVSRNKSYLGIIGVGDEIKETSVSAVALLKQMGIKTVMLTGDNEKNAKAVAELSGVDECIAEVLPQDKQQVIADLQKNYVVAMVGDGVNDAPALTQADVGFAVADGTDIANDSADVILVKNDLQDVPCAVKLSQKTSRNIKQNLFWAFFYNCVGIPVAAGALYFEPLMFKLSPMIAAAAMSLSSLFVVTNALRLRFFKPPRLEKSNVTADTPSCGEQCQIASELAEKEQITSENGEKIQINQQEKENTMSYQLSIEGMMCMRCVAHVEKALKSVEGVTAVSVSLENNSANVTASQGVTADALKQAVEEEGYTVTKAVTL